MIRLRVFHKSFLMCADRVGPLEEELFLAISDQDSNGVKRMLEAG